jgi:MFS family permease
VRSTFHALTIRNYRLYAGGSVISNVGTWLQRVAQDWLVLLLSGTSGTALGITTGLQFLPILLLTPYAGLLADRLPKRAMMMMTQATMALFALVLGLLAVSGVARTWHVYVLAFLFGVGNAFDIPARQSFVVEMVGKDDLANAVGLNSASFNAARVVGPAAAGGLISLFGGGIVATGWVILLNAASYGAVIFSLWRLRTDLLHTPVRAPREPRMIRAGVRYVRSRPDLTMILVVMFFAGTFGINFPVTLALMATHVYHKGAGQFGLLGSVMAIGSLAGALVAAHRGNPRHRLVVVAALLFALTEIVAGLMPSYLTFAMVLPVLGVTALTMITAANATMQLSVTPDMRGRVSALFMMIFMGGTPLGAPIMGWVGQSFGARWTLIGGGLVMLAGTVLAIAMFARSSGIVVRPKLDPRPHVHVYTREQYSHHRDLAA